MSLIKKVEYKYISPVERQKNTDTFITKYCQHYSIQNPRPPMRNPDVIDWHWDKLVRDYEGVDKDAVKRYLNKRKYKRVFLTSYWWYIIKHKRLAMDGFMCCGENCTTPDERELHVHHIDMTYPIRGEEILFMDGLITLCKHCHNLAHDKKPKKRKWGRKNIIVLEATEENQGIDNLISVAKSMKLSDKEICDETLRVLDMTIRLLR